VVRLIKKGKYSDLEIYLDSKPKSDRDRILKQYEYLLSFYEIFTLYIILSFSQFIILLQELISLLLLFYILFPSNSES
jgi:hypothetical protein